MFGLMTVSKAEQQLIETETLYIDSVMNLHKTISMYISSLRKKDDIIHALELVIRDLRKEVRAQTEADTVLNAIRVIQNK